MTEQPAARERWAALSPRARGALVRAVRAGRRVAPEDQPLAYEIATRELDRIGRAVRPGRLVVWRVVQGLLAVLFLLVAAAAVTAGDALRAGVFGGLSAVLGSSALLARRRLDRQVARLTAARDMNAVPQGTSSAV